MDKGIAKCTYHKLPAELQPIGLAVRTLAEQVGDTMKDYDNGSKITAAIARVSDLLHESKLVDKDPKPRKGKN